MSLSQQIRKTAAYVLATLVVFAAAQSLVVLMHEFTHSTVAWLVGDTPSPLDIVWGNPLMMTGWDEGVHYARLFPSGGDPVEALIGGSPLLMHTLIVALGMFLLLRTSLREKKWLFHAVYWFVVAHFMELIAYIVMRPFAPGGDTGHFNRGLGLSPWLLFVAGTLAILFGLYVLFGRILPALHTLFARGDRVNQWAILILSAFMLFVWGSGLRVVLYVYPDPQWTFGLIGFAAFGAFLFLYRPTRTEAP